MPIKLVQNSKIISPFLSTEFGFHVKMVMPREVVWKCGSCSHTETEYVGCTDVGIPSLPKKCTRCLFGMMHRQNR